jgi:electron transfer flavoprotein beta subunit
LERAEKEEDVNILICIKQVPDTEAQIKIDSGGQGIQTADIKWVMNPYDEYGVEEALRIKEKAGGKVTVIGVGPQRVVESLRTALAMGADEAIHVDDPAADGGDALATARVLAAAVKDVPFDLIFCGQRAVDDDNAQVGAALSELLQIPLLSVITKVEISEDKAKIKVQRPVEGATWVFETPLPALITTQKGLNEPRYASLPGIMKAKKKPMAIKKLGDLGLSPDQVGQLGSKLKIRALTPPPARKAGRIIEGETAQEKGTILVKLLREEAKII